MSYHILHIADYGCKIFKERGLLVCQKDDKILGKIAIEDLRAIIIQNEASSISGAIISELSANDAIIVHCKNYKPIGITIPNIRTYDAKVVLNQSSANKNLNSAIWRRILFSKIENSVNCLKRIGLKNKRIYNMYEGLKGELNEAFFAREYWKEYFPALGEFGQKRDPNDYDSRTNMLLNYGYGIVGAIIHRSIIVSGLNYLLGVNHKTYYKNTPLVYDIIEPFRAFVDFALYEYVNSTNIVNIRTWTIFFSKFLQSHRVKKGINSVKLLDASDVVCESMANVYRYKKAEKLWLPKFNL